MSDETRGHGGHMTDVTSVTPLRMPGQISPAAHAVAIERLMEAIILSSTISRAAAEAYAMMLKIASVSAPFGEHGPAVSKIIAELEKRLGMHLATLPNRPPPPPSAA
jgi:hypothetical protein